MTHVPVASIHRRSLALRLDRRAAAAVTGLALAPVLADNGGYFPTAWGWTVVGFGWAAALAVLLAGAPALSRLEWTFVGGLCTLGGWTAASYAWSISPTQTALETERLLAFIAVAIALVAIARPRDVHLLLGGAAVGSTAICAYALGTRLFPDRIGTFDPIAGARLSSPIGYWNSLGLVAAMTALLAASASTAAASRRVRVVAAASLPIPVLTLYFTFSRGAWIALFIGLVVLIAYERERLVLIARLLPAVAVSAVGVLLASRERALTHLKATIGAAAHDGHRLALVVVLLIVVAGVAAFVVDLAVQHVTPPRRLPRVATVVLAAVVVAAVAAALVHFGPPQRIPHRVYHSFVATPTPNGNNLNGRLFSLSGNGRWVQWNVALHAFEAHPLAGIGAGGYERYWLQHRPIAGKIRDVHNLYLEMAAETGVVGLALLLVALAAPFAALRRARDTRLAAGALAAYVAYLAHAFVDWDWELSGVTLVALLCGAALLIAARGDTARRPAPRLLLLAATAVVVVAGFIGLAGNIALGRAQAAARAGNWADAARDARRARTWAPWSTQPWQQLGEAQLGEGDVGSAVQSFDRALAKSNGDWNLWFDLARATTGAARQDAIAHAARLDPLSPEIAELRAEIAGEKVIQVSPK